MPHTSAAHPSPYSSPRARQRKIDDDGNTVENTNDDRQSTRSHASGVPRPTAAAPAPAPQAEKDALRRVAGHRVRHARCSPDFLATLGARGEVPESVRRATSKQFKIVGGGDARAFFTGYIACVMMLHLLPGLALTHSSSCVIVPCRTHSEPPAHDEEPEPIVFAVTAWEAGSKCIDYYMTWRAHPVRFLLLSISWGIGLRWRHA